jgi:hypothetical protein
LSVPGIDSGYHEKESAWLYRRVAAAEPDPKKRELFLQLATAAEEQAGTWRRVASEGGAQCLPERVLTPSLRARVVAALLRHFEVRSLRMVLAAMKVRGLSVYSAPQATAGHPMPTSLAEVGARHRHAFGGSLRAIVFGVNDGLVSNVSLVLGVTGAGVSSAVVLTTAPPACSRVRSPWPPASTSRCAHSARCMSIRSRSSARNWPRTRRRKPKNWR